MMEIATKLSVLKHLLLFLVMGLTVQTGYSQIEAKVLENCQNGNSKLTAETNGIFLGWNTTTGDTSTIESRSLQTTIVNPTQSTIYIAKSQHLGTNQITKGSFDSNEQFFTTDYILLDTDEFTTGNYSISRNPSEIIPAFVNKADHTGNNGYMLVADGSEDTSKSFFTYTINVVEGKTYQVKLYAANIHINLTGTTEKSGDNSAKIGIFINDVFLKSKSLPHDTTWTEFTYNWKSTFTGETTLTLKDKSSKLEENDFVVDDISFAEIFTDTDSIALEPCEKTASNVFSPNGDGQYDTFYIAESGTAKIYNSNGKLVQTLQVPGYWDGKTKEGQNALTDYYAIIIDGKKVKHVTLMR